MVRERANCGLATGRRGRASRNRYGIRTGKVAITPRGRGEERSSSREFKSNHDFPPPRRRESEKRQPRAERNVRRFIACESTRRACEERNGKSGQAGERLGSRRVVEGEQSRSSGIAAAHGDYLRNGERKLVDASRWKQEPCRSVEPHTRRHLARHRPAPSHRTLVPSARRQHEHAPSRRRQGCPSRARPRRGRRRGVHSQLCRGSTFHAERVPTTAPRRSRKGTPGGRWFLPSLSGRERFPA